MTEETKTNVEVLKEQLEKGYTEIAGLTVRSTWQGLSIVKQDTGFRDTQPVSINFSLEELSALKALASMLDDHQKAYRHGSTAAWKADDIVSNNEDASLISLNF